MKLEHDQSLGLILNNDVINASKETLINPPKPAPWA
jgi:hypothetical protein